MTEFTWLTTADPAAMLTVLNKGRPGSPLFRCRLSDRRLRLYACAISRLVGLQPAEPINECEAWADGGPPISTNWVVADQDPEFAARGSLDVHYGTVFGNPEPWWQRAKAELLRDIVGNPFQPVVMPCTRDSWRGDWLTPTVAGLARTAYDEREVGVAGQISPDRLFILADALEEAGCDSEPLMSHLRQSGPTLTRVQELRSGPVGCCNKYLDRMDCDCIARACQRLHVRGCWALDLLLGKE
jgi:hypothetical protein